MGEVFLAEHRNIERKAAIKFLLPEYSSKEELVTRFFTEARAASLIRHPGIVEILDCDVHPSGRAYIIMEFLEGESLRDHLGRLGRLDVVPALAIVRQIAEALAAAHLKGITHRDLKPDNVYLARGAAGVGTTVKVLDFGVAKLAAGNSGDGGGGHMTKTGHLLGTPLYMAPEQCRGTGSVDHRADIYALGCMTFELLAGRPPFIREGTGELLLAHITERPPAVTSLVASVPSELGALVARMLEKVPERRPQSMTEVSDEVGRLLGMPSIPPASASAPTLSAQIDTQPGLGPGAGGRRAAITPIAGGTQLLPDRDSTFSRAAAEVTEPVVESFRPGRRGRGWLLALAVLAAAAGAGYRFLGPSLARPTGADKPHATAPPEPTRAPAAAPALETEPPVATPPASVEVQIASDPAGAELWIEGEPRARGRTPLRLQMRRTARPLEAVLKAPGYLDRAFVVDPGESTSMVVDMEKVHKERSRPHRPTPARARSSGGEETFRPMGD